MLKSCKNLMNGIEPPEARNPDAYRVRPGDFKLPRYTSVADGASDLLVAATV